MFEVCRGIVIVCFTIGRVSAQAGLKDSGSFSPGVFATAQPDVGHKNCVY